MEHMEHAVWGDGAACGRGEHVFTVGFSPLLLEDFHGIVPDGHAPIGVFRLERCLYHLPVDPGNLAAHLDRAPLQVDVLPFEAQQFAPAQARGQLNVVHLEHAALPGLMQEGRQLLGGKGFHLPVLQLGQGTAVRGVGGDQLLVNGEIHGRGNHLVDVTDSFGAETLGLTLGLDPLYSAAAQQFFVELL